jgi:collagenase-like PrtC family protease
MHLNSLLINTIRKNPGYFHDGLKIASVFGNFYGSVWNGGRYLGGITEPQMLPAVTKALNDKGIPLRFTFTNPLITEEHLDDVFSNAILRVAHNGMNEVIVMSPILEKYIREKYPRYKFTSSTCKEIRDIEGVKAELKKDYKYVVLDYNFNNQFDILEQIDEADRSRCEILVNACCTPACKRRKEHYDYIGDYQIKLTEHMAHPNEPFDYKDFECPQMGMALYQTTGYSTHIKPEDIYNKYVPMGYENFKIEGRSVPDINVLEAYMYYMVKPEYRDEIRLFLTLSLTRGQKYFNN